ncbi:hypothetical protein LTR94_033285, partial [Friedmanniomyces endolithicus]
MTPREATIASMKEISIALFGGSTGVIYRQFSVTVVSAMILSVLVALILSLALTATLLKQRHAKVANGDGVVEKRWFERRLPRVSALVGKAGKGFNDGFDAAADRYRKGVGQVISGKWIYLAIYGGVV